MNAASKLIAAVRAAGGTVRVQGDRLHLSAQQPLPATLISQVKVAKTEVIQTVVEGMARAECCVLKADLPADLVIGITRMLGACKLPPQGYPLLPWLGLIHDTLALLRDKWIDKALALGWAEVDLFGADPIAPYQRVSGAGLALMIGGLTVTAISNDAATLKAASGSVQTYRRCALRGSVPIWELLKE